MRLSGTLEGLANVRLLSPESDDHLNLDALRFLSTAAIVVFHYQTVVAWSPALAFVREATHQLPIAVDLFFVMSGAIMADIYGGGRLKGLAAYGTFLRRRFARLAPLHYITLAFFVAAVAVATAMGVSPTEPRVYDARCIAPNLLFLQAFGICDHLTFNKPSWSISAEMVMYLLLPAVLWISRWRPLAWAFVAAFLVWAVVSQLQGHTGWPGLTWNFSFIRAFPSFLLGVLLAQSTGWSERLPRPGLLLGLFGAVFVAECFFQAGYPLRMVTVWIIAACALAADRQRKVSPVIRGLAPLGQLTYSIYMLHHPVGWLCISVLARRVLHLQGLPLNLAIAFVTFVLLPLVATASLFLFETPLRKRLSGRSAKRQPAEPAPETAAP